MPPVSKDFILDEIRRLAREAGGKPPGRQRFVSATQISQSYWHGRYWRSWSEALAEAGFSANELQRPIPDDELFRALVELTTKYGKLPSEAEITYESKRTPGIPSRATFALRFGKKAALLDAFLRWLAEHPEHAEEVLPLLARQSTNPFSRGNAPKRNMPTVSSEPSPLSESYVPPIVAALPILAEGADGEQAAVDVEFERRVAIAFTLLGLEVEQLGQGHGRRADGIASCPEEHWAVIYDAKVRRGGYKMGTEDRKFREYIEHHPQELAKRGIHRSYFAVVSSRFEPRDVPKAKELVRVTQAKACVFLEAAALVRLVERRLRAPRSFAFADIERLFASTRILRVADAG